MAKAFDFKLSGAEALQKRLNNLPKHMQKEVDTEIKRTVANINAEQVRKAPKDRGGLARDTAWHKGNGLEIEYVLFSNSPYAAWQEFGTGEYAEQYVPTLPAEIQQIASQYQNKSTGGDPKQLIFEWCKRQGIPEEYWWPIFKKIMNIGIRPQPYFFSPFLAEKDALVKRIANILKKI